MKQYLIIILLTPVLLLAATNKELYIKAKIESKDRIVKAKILIKHPMIGYEYYGDRRNPEENFISHITAMDTNKIIFDMSTSSYLRKNPGIEHEFNDMNRSNTIKYIIIDNKGNEQEFSFDIKRNNTITDLSKTTTSLKKDTAIDYKKLKPKVWKALTTKEAVTELYGLIKKPITNKIMLSGPESGYCEENIPIHISSDVDLESFAIFTDAIEHPAIAIFSIPNKSIVNFKLNVKIFKVCTDYSIIVVGKDRDGNIYRTSANGRIACADSCGGGG